MGEGEHERPYHETRDRDHRRLRCRPVRAVLGTIAAACSLGAGVLGRNDCTSRAGTFTPAAQLDSGCWPWWKHGAGSHRNDATCYQRIWVEPGSSRACAAQVTGDELRAAKQTDVHRSGPERPVPSCRPPLNSVSVRAKQRARPR
jgi:hypothetical protein